MNIVVLDGDILGGGEVREERQGCFLFCNVCEERCGGELQGCLIYGGGGHSGIHGRRNARSIVEFKGNNRHLGQNYEWFARVNFKLALKPEAALGNFQGF